MDSDGELDIVERAERTALEGDEDAEVQREASEDEVEEVQADGNEDTEDTTRQLIKPKRVVRNPKPKLNADTLRGPRGLTALAPLFAKQKFKGKGYEATDLNKMLKTYEYWCHRLYPKMRFEQCIEKIETLGSKKPVMTYVKRIRMGLLDDEPSEPRDDDAGGASTQDRVEDVEARFDSLARPEDVEAPLTDAQAAAVRANKERAMQLRAERSRRVRESDANTTTIERELCDSPTESQSHVTSAFREISSVFGDDDTENVPSRKDVTTAHSRAEASEEEIDVDEMLNDLNKRAS